MPAEIENKLEAENLPVVKKSDLSAHQTEIEFPEGRFLDEDYIKEIREYYNELFSKEENIKKLLKENGFNPLSSWVQGTKKNLDEYGVTEACLGHTLKILLEKYKDQKGKLEDEIIAGEFGNIPEIREETAKAIINYYGDVLETKLANAKSDKSKETIEAELKKFEEYLKKYEVPEERSEFQEKSEKKEELGYESKDISGTSKENELLDKTKEAVEKSLKEAVGRIKNLTDNQLLLSGIEREELNEEIKEFQMEHKTEEIVKECFEAFKEKYPAHYWTASNLVKDWADAFVQSEFTVFGSEALKNAYRRAYQVEKGISKLKGKKPGLTQEELKQISPKSNKDFSSAGMELKKEGGVAIEEILINLELKRLYEIVKDVAIGKYGSLLEESRGWIGFKDDERRNMSTLMLKAALRNQYEKRFIPAGSPSEEKFIEFFVDNILGFVKKKIKR